MSYPQEFYWLTLTVLFSALLWVPYILNRMIEHSPWPALWNPQPDKRPKAQWAERLMCAHSNAVENLVIFAPLALMVGITGVGNDTTAAACMVYFVVRVAHVLLYTFAVPLLRSVMFLIGVVCQVVLAWALLQAL